MGVKILEAGEQSSDTQLALAHAVTAPSAVVRAASDVAYESDARGRRIGVRRIDALKLYRLTKVLGATATNQSALNLAMSAASVVEIDGEPVGFPASEMQVEALMSRLDFEGLAAATAALRQLDGSPDEIRAAAGN